MEGGRNDMSPCSHCGLAPLEVGDELDNYTHVDPCLGLLPDVAHACCGHGHTDAGPKGPYVVIAEGCQPGTWCSELEAFRTLRGSQALAYFAKHGVGPVKEAAA